MDNHSTHSEVQEIDQVTNVQNSNDRIYLLGLAIGLIHYILPETTIDAPDIIELFLKASMFLLLTLQLIVAFPKYTNGQKLLIFLLFFVVVAVGFNTTHWGTVYSLYALIVGAKDIDYRKILKVFFKVGSILCISVVSLSLSGMIENRDILSEGHGLDTDVSIRYCMGYIWPTDFATHVFFILLSFWLLVKGRLSFFQSLAFLIIAYFVFSFSDAKLGSGCIILLIICSIYLKIKEKLSQRFEIFSKSIRLVKYLWVFYIPFLFFISIWTVVSYDEGSLVWFTLNMMLSGRFALGQEILEREGYTLFGQEYQLIGGTSVENLYNYIDSSYLQSLIIYGVAFSVILVVSYMKLTSVACNNRNYPLLYAILVAGISGAIAQHFLQIFMNPLLIGLVASNIELNKNDEGNMIVDDINSNKKK